MGRAFGMRRVIAALATALAGMAGLPSAWGNVVVRYQPCDPPSKGGTEICAEDLRNVPPAKLWSQRKTVDFSGHGGGAGEHAIVAAVGLPDVAIEPSVHIDAGLTRRSLQIVVRGSARTDSETKIRWKLSPAGASGEPT